ncbi:MAG TPA: VIT1/CCC1 transporter family protein [Flavipsychrobacter sp.]|nr:VIT1/CCC1 transporter family protein [Flavipsychrobacter sp.]
MSAPKSKDDFIVDFIVGMSDGLVIPFAVAIGLSVLFSPFIIIVTTLCIVGISAVAMALSRYFSIRSSMNQEHVHEIISSLGLDHTTQNMVRDEATKTNNEWQAIMNEVNDVSRSGKSALNVGLSYLVSGIIPVVPFLLIENDTVALKFSVIVSVLALFVFGFVKGRLTAQNGMVVGLKTIIVGCITALSAYCIATLFVTT